MFKNRICFPAAERFHRNSIKCHFSLVLFLQLICVFLSLTFCFVSYIFLMESANHFQWFVLKQKVTKNQDLDLFASYLFIFYWNRRISIVGLLKNLNFFLENSYYLSRSEDETCAETKISLRLLNNCPRFKHWKFLSVVY